MARILALDIGDVWVGSALSDATGLIASPLDTINFKDLFKFLEEIVKKYDIKSVVVGYPKSVGGNISQQTQKTLDVYKKLQAEFLDLQFILWDERFSSKRAKSLLQGKQLHRRKNVKNKQHEHSLAAAFILDSYLVYTSNKLAYESM